MLSRAIERNDIMNYEQLQLETIDYVPYEDEILNSRDDMWYKISNSDLIITQDIYNKL